MNTDYYKVIVMKVSSCPVIAMKDCAHRVIIMKVSSCPVIARPEGPKQSPSLEEEIASLRSR